MTQVDTLTLRFGTGTEANALTPSLATEASGSAIFGVMTRESVALDLYSHAILDLYVLVRHVRVVWCCSTRGAGLANAAFSLLSMESYPNQKSL